ncbi:MULTISPECIES: MBL fold metallo-hydrolase [Thermomonosporaceae]|uniref:MBL fold metallo-hydrolase n=1 Tax=Thermomonosporaceae TaxID=2012 RepID=UPI00255A9182|nr:MULTISPECIES: MBL fold metallo-hydrolase [Thermomonosporaceae]MDL4774348.1 MBL fold metallo-hydrolase [Actinomadura xylanilytica]
MRLDGTVDLVGGGRLGPGLSNPYDSNVYLLRTGEGAWLVDTGCGLGRAELAARVSGALDGRAPAGAVLTHAHPDHAGGAAGLVDDLGIPVLAGAGTARLVRVGDHDRLGLTAALRAGLYPAGYRFAACAAVAGIEAGTVPGAGGLRALPTPGHCEDHTAYVFTGGDGTTYAFTGDLVFARGRVVVAADSDVRLLRRSLEAVLAERPDVLLPGHGTPVLSDARWHLERALEAFDQGRLPAAFG